MRGEASGECVDAPLARNALQLVAAAVDEFDTRARDQVLDGPGDEHLSGLCERGNAGASVNGDSPNGVLRELDLPGVETGAYLEPERPDALDDRARTANAAPARRMSRRTRRRRYRPHGRDSA